MGKKRFAVTLCFIAFFVCLGNGTRIFAAGQGDPILSRADQLVKEKRFNEALQILSGFIKEDDIRFDTAQERIRKILRNREYYNQLVNRLMDTVEKNPDDYESIIKIANDLRQLDAPYDESVRRFVGRIQEIARFTVNRRVIEQILREGRALLDAGDYIAAMQKYQTGFRIYQTELREARFSPQLEQEAMAALTAVGRAIGTAADTLPQINNVRSSVALMARSNSPAGRQALNNAVAEIVPQLDRLIEAKQAFAQAEAFFEATAESPQIQNSASPGRHFFSSSALFVRGRGHETIREGMLGAVDALWNSAVLPLNDAFADVSEMLYQLSMVATEKADYPQANRNISDARDFIRPMMSIAEKAQTFVSFDPPGLNQRLAEASFATINDSIGRFRAMDTSLSYLNDATDFGSRLNTLKSIQNLNLWDDWKAGRIETETAFDQMHNIRAGFSEINTQITTELASIDRNTTALKAELPAAAQKNGAETPVEAGLRYFGDSRRIISALGTTALGELAASTEQLYTIANNNIKQKLEALENQYAESQRLLTGVAITTEQGQDVVAKYSREAAGVLETIDSDLDASIEMGAMILEEYQRDIQSGVELGARITRFEEETAEYTRRLRELETQEQRDLPVAVERAGRAESLRVEGARRLVESRRALDAGDFDTARDSLEATVARWNESLDLQENAALRRAWINEVDPLAKEITALEYEFVLRDVRDLINNSRERYFAGNFEMAEQALMRAENRWSRVSVDPNNEIIYWLGLVRGALSLRSGSNVPVTAPLYPEFSQLLSDAKKNYNAGLSLINVSRREEGIMRFAMAREKTQEIKLMFPVNQEAGILELRIDQVIDPSTFEEAFRQRFVAAVAGTKRGSRESYFELENLAQINPRYTGITAALTEAQYDVGLKQRPLDERTTNRSTSLLAQAQQIFSRNNTARFQEALQLATEALTMNPNSAQAMQLVDRIRLSIGSRVTIVADPNAEQEYLVAVREFQQGNNLIAMSIIQRLLQHPANRNNKKFNDLRTRIAATL